jgi:Icc-related predicted phosphoesterase
MKICCFADTHMQHNKVKIPECDVLIFAGDFACSRVYKEEHLIDFNIWLSKQSAKYKLFVAGNHDVIFEQNKKLAISLLSAAKYLEDEAIIINGVKFYGTPYGIIEDNWSFGKNEVELEQIYKKIPYDTDILITHYPPFRIMDLKYNNRRCGSQNLVNEIKKRNIKHHIFGHCHEFYGIEKKGDTYYINCSMCGGGNVWKNVKPVYFLNGEFS